MAGDAGRRGGVPTLPILYIGGWGRSGSTLLARMLAQLPGVLAVGELRDVWLRGCVENRLCGCGAPFLQCSFWSAVGERAFGGWDRVDADRMLHLRATVDRPWTMPLIASGGGWPGFRERLSEYVDSLGRLYRAISEVPTARVIVDSSKIPSYALLLARIAGADVRVLHLVRDSRGVMFSWRKHVRRPDRQGEDEFMIRYGLVSGTARYVGYNVMTEALRRRGRPYLLMRYEDLVAAPDRHLRRILRGLPEVLPSADLSFVEGHEVRLTPTHTVDGNPMRFERGRLMLRPDEQWRMDMSARERLVVSTLSSPLLLRYGYRLGSGPS